MYLLEVDIGVKSITPYFVHNAPASNREPCRHSHARWAAASRFLLLPFDASV